MPPQASITSRYSVPMGTSMFWGLAMASPSTVTRFDTRGMPVLRNLPSVDTEVTFMMTQPGIARAGPACRKGRPAHFAAGAGLDERFLGALRVAHGQALDLDALHLAGQRGEQVDTLGLVALDADDAVRDLAVLHDSGDAGDDRVAALHHLAAVGGQVRLTLGRVDEQRVDGVGRQLDVGREARAADAHQTAGLDSCHQACLVGDDRRHAGRVNGLCTIGLDGDCGSHAAVGHTQRGDILHGAGHAGIDVGGHKAAGLADHGAYHDGVAFFDDRLCGRADVHGHGNDNVLRHRHLVGRLPGCRLRVRHSSTLGRAL